MCESSLCKGTKKVEEVRRKSSTDLNSNIIIAVET